MEEHSNTTCPQCRHGNPPENRFCGACGAPLTSSRQLARQPAGELPAASGRALLPAELKPVGRALAVGLATLAAQAGLAWLSRRAGDSDRPPPATKGTEPAIPEHLVYQSFEEVYAWVRERDFESRMFAQQTVRSLRAANPTDGQR